MKLTKYDNFFTESCYEEILETSKHLLKNNKHAFCTNYWWEHDVVKDSFPVLIHSIYKTTELFNKIRNEIETKTHLAVKEHDIMIYYWTRFSYIPWHRDKDYAGALTVYINEKWEPDWGGYFMYEDDQSEIRAILPKRNFGLLQQGGIKHCTTPVNFDGGMRISIQAFLEQP